MGPTVLHQITYVEKLCTILGNFFKNVGDSEMLLLLFNLNNEGVSKQATNGSETAVMDVMCITR
jgi:hypothetical protein